MVFGLVVGDDYLKQSKDLFSYKTAIIFLALANNLKLILAFSFLIVRTMEQEILLLFIKHQRKYSLESLYVTKDNYRQTERRIERFFKFCIVVNTMLQLSSVCYEAYAYSKQVSERITLEIVFIGYIGVITFTLAIYNSTMFELIRETYKYHRLEF